MVSRELSEKLNALLRVVRDVADDPYVVPQMKRRMYRLEDVCHDFERILGSGWTEFEKTGIAQPEEVTSAAK